MKPLRLTRWGGDKKVRSVLVNWDNVDFALITTSHFGDEYTEIHCGKQTIEVKETLEEIEQILHAPRN